MAALGISIHRCPRRNGRLRALAYDNWPPGHTLIFEAMGRVEGQVDLYESEEHFSAAEQG
jgi:hypothetical protein